MSEQKCSPPLCLSTRPVVTQRPPSPADLKPAIGAPRCAGCGAQIVDRFVLRVLPDQHWHAACLKCTECAQELDETWTCFVREGLPYCRQDYSRLFGARCARCASPFSERDLVMRAARAIYHVDCFRCVACGRRLATGDEFALREDRLLCREDWEQADRTARQADTQADTQADRERDNEGGRETDSVAANNNNDDVKDPPRSPPAKGCSKSSGRSGHGGHGGRGSGTRSHKSDQKTTRIRTVLNEKQLHTLRTCYGANPRPDALMKEQLVEMTGLNSRVIRVWFQNKRCKDKKRSILLKQIHQQQLEKGDDCDDDVWLGMCQKGIPLIAMSPMRHEAPPSSHPHLAPVEIHQYPSPWKALSDFALQSELEHPPFRQLVRSFGDSSGDEDDFQLDDDTVVSFDEPALIGRASTRSRPGQGDGSGQRGGKHFGVVGQFQQRLKQQQQQQLIERQLMIQHQQQQQAHLQQQQQQQQQQAHAQIPVSAYGPDS